MRAILAMLAAAVMAGSASLAWAQPLTFIAGGRFSSTGRQATLTVVNTVNGRAVATFDLGPSGTLKIAAVPDGSRVFAMTDTGLLRLDVATGVVESLNIMAPLKDIVVSPDGRDVYGASRDVDTLVRIDATTGVVVGSAISVPGAAERLALSRTGDRLYALDAGGATISIIDTAAGTMLRTIATDPAPVELMPDADGSRVFVAHSTRDAGSATSDSLVAYDAASGEVLGRVALPDIRTAAQYWPGPILVYASSRAGRMALPGAGARLLVPRMSVTTVKGGTMSYHEVVDVIDTTTVALLTTRDLTPMSWSIYPGTIAATERPGSADALVASANSLWSINGTTHAVTTVGRGGDALADLSAAPAPRCWFEVAPSALSLRSPGGGAQIVVPTLPDGCSWTASPSANWIGVTPGSGSSAGTVSVDVGASETPRSGTITIAGQPITIDQRIMHVYIDAPLAGRSLTGPFALVGWAIDQDARTTAPAAWTSGIDDVRITDETPGEPVRALATTSTTNARPDVAAAFGDRYGNPGFRVMISTLPQGRRVIVVRVRSAHDGVWHSTSIELVGAGPSVASAVDAPPAPEPSHAGFRMSGWAVDRNAPSGCGIASVHVWAFPHAGGDPRFLGAVGVGWPRPDLPAHLGMSAPLPCGWVLNMAPLPAGGYRFVAYAFAQATGAVESEAGLDGTIRLKPFGVVDSPVPGTQVSGAIGITGWALDDNGVNRVAVFNNNTGQFIADATFVEGARPDVAAAYPGYPNRTRGGWGVSILTNMLPNGGNGDLIFQILAYDADGHVTLLATLHVLGVNQSSTLPFGTIDLPAQGATISGTVPIFGWALTPAPNIIPADGSTIEVIIDDVVAGRPAFGQCRGTNGTNYPAPGTCNDDIATTFGMGYRNLSETSGAIGSFLLDTTTLTNGLHSLVWRVRDSAGNLQGIGSRFFYVDNPTAEAAGGKVSVMLARGVLVR